MAALEPATVDGVVSVEPHAVAQARARFACYAGKDDETVAAEIAADVRKAIDRGQWYDRRPRGFYVTSRSRHGGGGLMPLGQRFVMHPAGDRGWVVSLATARSGDVAVITTLRKIERQR